MIKHSRDDCIKVAEAMKAQIDYALFAIKSNDDQDCKHCLDQVRQLLEQLEREKA